MEGGTNLCLVPAKISSYCCSLGATVEILDGIFVRSYVIHLGLPIIGIGSKIHSYAEKIEMGEMIEYDENDREYYPTKKFEDTSESQIFIQEFENESFWDGLTNRLVQREIEKLKKAKKIPEKLEIEEYFRISTPIEEIFNSEFEKNGLDNFELKSNIKCTIPKI